MPSKNTSRTNAKDVEALAAKMRGIDLCMMTTHAEDGGLHTFPMSNNGEVEFDGDAWFFSAKDTRKVAELAGDDHVTLSYVGGSDGDRVWIALEGNASIVEDADKKKELWLDELDRWFDNGPEDPNVVLIHVQGTAARWWSGDEQAEIQLS